MQIVVPMAGSGRRFSDAGYKLPKPLLPVAGVPMVVQAVRDLPPRASRSRHRETRARTHRRSAEHVAELPAQIRSRYLAPVTLAARLRQPHR